MAMSVYFRVVDCFIIRVNMGTFHCLPCNWMRSVGFIHVAIRPIICVTHTG